MKQCKQCGKFFSDYAQTCSFCHSELRLVGSEDAAPEQKSFDNWKTVRPKDTKPAQPEQPRTPPQAPPQMPPQQPPQQPPVYRPQQPKKSPLVPILIGVGGVIAVAVIAAVVVFVMGHKSSAGEAPVIETSSPAVEDTAEDAAYLADMAEVESICAELDEQANDGSLTRVSVTSTVTAWMEGDSVIILKANAGTDGSEYDRTWYCRDGEVLYVAYEGDTVYHMYLEYGEPFVVRYWTDFSDSEAYTDFTDDDNMNKVYSTFMDDFADLSADAEAIVAEEEPTVETSAAAAEPVVDGDTEASDDYIFPDSSTRIISESEYSALSQWDLRVAINEIYARHGRLFKDAELQSYFDSKSWYNGTVDPDAFNNNPYAYGINETEVQNATNMRNYYNAHYN